MCAHSSPADPPADAELLRCILELEPGGFVSVTLPQLSNTLAFVVERLLACQCRQEAMPRILQAAAILSAKAALTAQAHHYREQLRTRFPDSEEAHQLAARLPA